METTQQDFDGVFRFTNATTEDFKFLWNNREYTFKAGTCSPMLISGETPENVQEIRKKAAKKLALREFYKSQGYNDLVTLGNKSAMGIPPTFNEEELAPWIQECLQPLPIAKAEVVELKTEKPKIKAFKTIGEKSDLREEFRKEISELE